jgi:thioredoxin reductase (NADPH)
MGREVGSASRPVASHLHAAIPNPRGTSLMRQPNVTIYGSRTCPDTTRATQHLDEKKVPYEFKDVDESPEYNDYIAGLNNGKRVMPTIRINNETYINPDMAKLDEVLSAETPEE